MGRNHQIIIIIINRISGYVVLPLMLLTAHIGGAHSDWALGNLSVGGRVAGYWVGVPCQSFHLSLLFPFVSFGAGADRGWGGVGGFQVILLGLLARVRPGKLGFGQ